MAYILVEKGVLFCMAMTWVWCAMVVLSLLFGALGGELTAVTNAAAEGAAAAIELCISIGGVMCLWSGVMEIMDRCGLSASLARLLRPLLRRLLPNASRDDETMSALCANLSANLLGLGNAATPLGIRAARRMARGANGTATDELCLLVVLNTASIQLLPTTVAALRAANGAAEPFDILGAVWVTSIFSVTVGLLTARLLAHAGRRRR